MQRKPLFHDMDNVNGTNLQFDDSNWLEYSRWSEENQMDQLMICSPIHLKSKTQILDIFEDKHSMEYIW